MTVTKLTASKRVPGRFYADFESGETLRVTEELIIDFGLVPERELTDEEFSDLRELAVEANAKSRALRILGAKMCSSGELKHRLVELGENEDTAEDACNWCADMGLLNDGEYARQVVDAYAARGYGARKIRDELYRRRVPREFWDELLESSAETAVERALEFIEKKLRGKKADRDERRKIGAALARRGFSWEEIKEAFSMYGEDSDFEDLNSYD